MLLSGIYATKFISSLRLWGTGVVVFTEDNRLHGGDATFFYKGKYSRHDPNLVEATVDGTKYSGGAGSVVGLDRFRLKLKGTISEKEEAVEIILRGHVEEDPSREVSIELRRLDDLVEA